MHPQVRVLRHRAPQRLANLGVAVLELFIAPGLVQVGDNLVAEVALETQFAAHVIVKGGGVRPLNGCVRRIVGKGLPRRVALAAGKTAVETAYSQFFFTQQFADETHDVDAQVRALEIPLTQPRIAGELGADFCTLLFGQTVALQQRERVVTERKRFSFTQNFSQQLFL